MKRLAVQSFLSLLLLSPLSLTGGQAFARGMAHGNGDARAGAHDPGMFMAKALGLTDEQKAALQPLHDQLAAATQPLRADLHQKWQAVQASLEAGADAAAVGKQVIDAYATMQQLRQAHDQFEAAFTALLTPDQQAKLATFKAAHQDMAGAHGGPGFPPF